MGQSSLLQNKQHFAASASSLGIEATAAETTTGTVEGVTEEGAMATDDGTKDAYATTAVDVTSVGGRTFFASSASAQNAGASAASETSVDIGV